MTLAAHRECGGWAGLDAADRSAGERWLRDLRGRADLRRHQALPGQQRHEDQRFPLRRIGQGGQPGHRNGHLAARLAGSIIGTPGLDGGHVIAASSYGSGSNHNGLWLIGIGNGKLLKSFAYASSLTFGQPVFAEKFVFVAGGLTGLTAYGPR